MGHLHSFAGPAGRALTIIAAPSAGKGPWKRAVLWLAGLAPFFYASYGLANYLADQRAFVPSIVFGWEHGIPFLPWTIIPYWSINLFYAASLFVCTTRDEVDTLGRRLLTAQAIAVCCFIAFPLRFTFARPAIGGGISGLLFDALLSFDKPYNQAPSLHIALLVILWVHYWHHVPRWARLPLHLWYTLIGASVLTTYQHHFFDIPTGAVLGLFCLWLWPGQGNLALSRGGDRGKRWKLASFYGLGALMLAIAGIRIGGWGLWLCYPAISLALVGVNYALIGAAGFQKRADGTMPIAARLLFAPYQAGAFLNSRLWTRHDPQPVEVVRGVYLGRIPSRFDRRGQPFAGIIDAAAELPALQGRSAIHAIAMLDLVAPSPVALYEAAIAIEKAGRQGTVLVCCALGYSRSAASLATWLLKSGRARSVDEAVAILRGVRPRIVLGAEARKAIATAAEYGNDG
jgi:hypothetical protein